MDRRHLIQTGLMALCGLSVGLIPLGGAVASSSSSGSSSKASYIAIPPASGVIPRRDGRRSILSVELGLDVPESALRERVTLSRPRLSAAYNEVVRTTASRMLPGTPPDIDAIGRALQAATDRVLGRAGAKLLLGTVVVN